jgi:hypothetical protein
MREPSGDHAGSYASRSGPRVVSCVRPEPSARIVYRSSPDTNTILAGAAAAGATTPTVITIATTIANRMELLPPDTLQRGGRGGSGS